MTALALPHGAVAIQIAGGVTLVDAEDAALASAYRWAVDRRKTPGVSQYAVRSGPVFTASGYRTRKLHRLIMDAVPGVEIDHINGDGLDNRRVNLRFASRRQNQSNVDAGKNQTGYRGVCRRVPNKGTYQAKISVDCNVLHLGSFRTPEEAALAYDRAALVHHGEFAVLNGAAMIKKFTQNSIVRNRTKSETALSPKPYSGGMA